MFLRKNFSKKTGRTQLAIVQGYRDVDKKIKHKTIKSVGYLDVLEKEYDDPIAHFTAIAKTMDSERKTTEKIELVLDLKKKIKPEDEKRKNYGYIVFSKIYYELELNRFLNNARRHENFKFNSEAIMRLIVFSRLLQPGSKRKAYLNKDQFFDKFDFTIDDIYDALTHFNKIAEDLQRHLHQKIVEQYNRKTNLVYYDVTNFYFEIDKPDDFRKKGYSKEGRKSPIVQMGLLMDTNAMPISYKMFPGNTHDSQTLMPAVSEIKKRYNVDRLVTVADKGLNSGDNIAYALALGDGYIYSKSVRGANKEFKDWVLKEDDYRSRDGKNKIKSRVIPNAEIKITVGQNGKNKKKKTIKIEQKQVIVYSEKYANRARFLREEAIKKAQDLIANPAKYQKACDYGASGYIKNLKIDKETGEIMNIADELILDEAKILEEEKFDGYYAIITSELDDTDEHIAETYKGLWRIEESFKISKSILGSRPVNVQTKEHINAHFLSCFISLLISRIIEIRLEKKYSISRIVETLNKVACSPLEDNIWHFNYSDEITSHISSTFEIDFEQKYMTKQEIKNNFAKGKKRK